MINDFEYSDFENLEARAARDSRARFSAAADSLVVALRNYIALALALSAVEVAARELAWERRE